MQGVMRMGGRVNAKVMRAKGPGLRWWLVQLALTPFVWGWLGLMAARLVGKLFGVPTMRGSLKAVLFRANGEVVRFPALSFRVVTSAGVNYIVDDWDGGANTIDAFNYHGCGTGTTAENASDTALVTESTTALNPDSTRPTGTKTQPSANIMQTVGTSTFDASAAITEHGIFTQAATGGGTLLDRSIFSAINVVSGDSIQWTYQLTLTAGS